MAGYMQHSVEEVPWFWYRMTCEESNVKPDNFTFASVLTGLAALSDLQMGLQVHAQLVKLGHGSEISVGNALTDMYIKNQRPIDGFRAFEEMPERNVCSWTQIAAGCLQCEEPGKALEVISEMKQAGVRLNRFTLATALNACASLASLEEGRKFHGLRIKLGNNEVDVCVDNALLDMYAKSGCMEGAWTIFRSMEDHNTISWTTMIMGCAQNGQAREGLEIFEEMKQRGTQPNYVTFICVLYACCQGGFTEEGWEYFASMTKHGVTPGDDHYVCMVNLFGRAGKIKEAEELILGMPFQASGMVWQALLGACLVHGDLETGRRAASKAMTLEKRDSSSYVLLSNMFASMCSWDNVGTLRDLMETTNVKKVPGTSWV
ncbi:PREDICTED: pentatricopeptide repeat-containing protein At2g03880, mitochondrial-like isoform X2 [Tarenaya hassleriana]|nr:PREDICTED: pentatricopeptide repeat-containing protein At2g03880, mitochondrial-like isoform X2 [Tarenaya hassleriana]